MHSSSVNTLSNIEADREQNFLCNPHMESDLQKIGEELKSDSINEKSALENDYPCGNDIDKESLALKC